MKFCIERLFSDLDVVVHPTHSENVGGSYCGQSISVSLWRDPVDGAQSIGKCNRCLCEREYSWDKAAGRVIAVLQGYAPRLEKWQCPVPVEKRVTGDAPHKGS